MNAKLRPLYLLLGFVGLFFLIFQLITTIQNLDLVLVLAIAVPDMFVFYLAYLTYPPERDTNRYESF
ncbi:MAG TPA: hypothetical protein VFE53_12590 [Mucilaginibacter sp.]|jgi:hypothetical protein|nr:hypothetical protein [Mucilaginibacter sp.]